MICCELGKNSPNFTIPFTNVNQKINILYAHGDHIMKYYRNVNKDKRGNVLQNKNDFKEILLPIIQNNDYLMIKGSNATGLNKISKNLTRGELMLFNLLTSFIDQYSFLNVFKYLTFRTGLSLMTSLIVVFSYRRTFNKFFQKWILQDL